MTPDAFMAAYEAATAAHDLEATLALVADDAVFLFSNETCHPGKPAIRRALQANFAAIEAEDYRLEGLRWLVRGEDAAVCVFEFHWRGRVRGQPAAGRGRGTSVLARRDGAWRLVHEHLSRGTLEESA